VGAYGNVIGSSKVAEKTGMMMVMMTMMMMMVVVVYDGLI
jgi:hypothetical protein